MRIALLGCGAMGRGAAYGLCTAESDIELILIDRDPAQLASLEAWLRTSTDHTRLHMAVLDLSDPNAVHDLLTSVDVCALALPWIPTKRAFQAALNARRPAVSITRPVYSELDELATWPNIDDGQLLFPCGLEPGLTEIFSLSVASMLSSASSLHVRCGGLAVDAAPPLYYRLLFDDRLPFTQRPAYSIANGTLITTRRFTGLEEFFVDGVGTLECHHDGMVPWMAEDPTIANITDVSQKTVRWPGFTRCVQNLIDLGLLSEEPVNVKGAMCAPRDLVETALAPMTRRNSCDVDMTILRVEAHGLDHDHRERRVQMDLMDRYDAATGLTSMARTTGFTLASVAQMLGRGEIDERGLLMPHRVITGDRRERLFADLRTHGVQITTTVV